MASAACSEEPSASSDAADSGGASGGPSDLPTGGTVNVGDGGAPGGSASGAQPGSSGDSSAGGDSGEAGASGASGTGGGTSVCGDGLTQADEVCDDGFQDACGSCNADCSATGSGSTCDGVEFCEEVELGVCDCERRPVSGVEDGIVRFVALGDGGEGNATQLKVAQAVAVECELRGGCDFALYLGDNIYDTGAVSETDPQFSTKFELPYCGLDFPFYVVLGNHDYGNGASLDEAKGGYQLAYSAHSSKWKLPDYNYTVAFEEEGTTLDIFALDTMRAFLGVDVAAQASWLSGALGASTATWKLVFGHHPYVSNGQHGNAGNYEGTSIPPTSGANLEPFFDDELCGTNDLYLSGHDHNRQWLEADCGLEVVVSGTAAKRTSLVGRDGNTTYFEEDVGGGFALFEIDGETLSGWFYDENGIEEFERTLTK